MSRPVLARVVLNPLVFIHLILPFTPVDQHEETGIVVVSMCLGMAFLWLSRWSHQRGRRVFATGGALLTCVIALSHATGASPIAEGWPVTLVFLTGLAYGIWSLPVKTNRPAIKNIAAG